MTEVIGGAAILGHVRHRVVRVDVLRVLVDEFYQRRLAHEADAEVHVHSLLTVSQSVGMVA